MSIETSDTQMTPPATPSQTRGTSAAPSAASRALAWGAASLRRLGWADWTAVGLWVAAFAYRLYLIARGWPQLDSDEAVIGLMARHILHGEYPVFFWGQNYMGAFQAYFAALFFALFGVSTFWLHFSVLLLAMGFLAAMYGLGRAAYGRVVGLLVLFWLTLGPTMGVLRELKAIGGYQEIMLFGALMLLGVWARIRQPNVMPTTRRDWLIALVTYAALGEAMGIGLWSDLLILPVLLLVAIALIVARPREVFSVLGLTLVLLFVVSAYPYIRFNIVYSNATYTQLAKMNRTPGQHGPVPPLHNWAIQTGESFEVALPTILGSPFVCVKAGNIWTDYPSAMATKTTVAGGVCDTTNLLFSLGALALYALALAPLLMLLWRWGASQFRLAQSEAPDDPSPGRLRRWGEQTVRAGRASLLAALTVDRATPTEEARAQAERLARNWLRLLLIGVGVANILAYTSSVDAQNAQFTSARYLLLVYLSAPVFFGVLWGGASPIAHWLAAWLPARVAGAAQASARATTRYGRPTRQPPRGQRNVWRGVRMVTASAGLALLLALSLYGGAQTLAYSGTSALFAQPMPTTDQHLIAFLGAHHIQTFYGDYWTCYRLAFESNEQAICAVRGGDPPHTLDLNANRYLPYVQAVARAAHPAYILTLGSQADRTFVVDTVAQGLPHSGYQRVVIGSYAVYYFP